MVSTSTHSLLTHSTNHRLFQMCTLSQELECIRVPGTPILKPTYYAGGTRARSLTRHRRRRSLVTARVRIPMSRDLRRSSRPHGSSSKHSALNIQYSILTCCPVYVYVRRAELRGGCGAAAPQRIHEALSPLRSTYSDPAAVAVDVWTVNGGGLSICAYIWSMACACKEGSVSARYVRVRY